MIKFWQLRVNKDFRLARFTNTSDINIQIFNVNFLTKKMLFPILLNALLRIELYNYNVKIKLVICVFRAMPIMF